MASVNMVVLVGHLGKDPELRYAPDGTAFANVSIATSEQWIDKASGEKKEATEWHRLVFSGRLAEIAGEYLKKGSQIYVRGRIRTRKWQDKDGQDRYTTEIRADELKMLGSRGESASPSSSSGQPAARPAPAEKPAATPPAEKKPAGRFDDMEDDIPFASCSIEDDVIFKKQRRDRE